MAILKIEVMLDQIDKVILSNKSLPWLGERTIFITVSGSRAYGLDTPESDYDYKGIAIPPKECFLGFNKKFEQAEFREPMDLVIYDIRKFLNLAANGNPNILEILYTNKEHHLVRNLKTYYTLINNRHLFLSKKVRYTFSGYAIAQLKRIREYNKNEAKNFKHAMHMARLMRMCQEILTNGQVNVKRPDREELLYIRSGGWTYEYLSKWAFEKDKELDELYQKSNLPNSPDRNKLDELCMEIVKENI